MPTIGMKDSRKQHIECTILPLPLLSHFIYMRYSMNEHCKAILLKFTFLDKNICTAYQT